jgi:DNA-binding response OmpR family regulator
MTLPQSVMIVEDELVTQLALKSILFDLNVEVKGCYDNAKETLLALKEVDCDMLLLDIDIKGAMDGIQLARKILQNKEVAIIFITSHDDEETVDEVLELAPYGFISKPFSAKEITVALQIAYKRYTTHSKVFYTEADKVQRDIILDESYTYSKQFSELYKNGVSVKLNPKQRKLLALLVDNINHTVSYDVLVSAIWGIDTISASGLRTLVYSLRKTVPELNIHSHSKIGYALQAEIH